jgi:hypothetical protein
MYNLFNMIFDNYFRSWKVYRIWQHVFNLNYKLTMNMQIGLDPKPD